MQKFLSLITDEVKEAIIVIVSILYALLKGFFMILMRTITPMSGKTPLLSPPLMIHFLIMSKEGMATVIYLIRKR